MKFERPRPAGVFGKGAQDPFEGRSMFPSARETPEEAAERNRRISAPMPSSKELTGTRPEAFVRAEKPRDEGKKSLSEEYTDMMRVEERTRSLLVAKVAQIEGLKKKIQALDEIVQQENDALTQLEQIESKVDDPALVHRSFVMEEITENIEAYLVIIAKEQELLKKAEGERAWLSEQMTMLDGLKKENEEQRAAATENRTELLHALKNHYLEQQDIAA